VIRRGLAGSLNKNHAANGSSPTLWLQDDRYDGTPEVGRVLWDWPGVINVMALSRQTSREDDTWDDLPCVDERAGRDLSERVPQMRSGYPRDPKVRGAVRDRANGHCERTGCLEHRLYSGFLDVHHIFGIGVSDRVWTCVALCPNCHREAHFGPDRDALNEELAEFARQFAI
jgi:5-methylcytosine-specific restriction protein A